MRRFGRLTTLVLAVAMGVGPGFAAHTAVASPPGYYAPGEYAGSSFYATFQTFVNGTADVSASVVQGSFTNKPKSGPTVRSSYTSLNLSVFDDLNGIFDQGCWMIPPGDFVANSDLSSMTLITTIQDSTPDCGTPNSFPSGTVISLQWLGTGPVASSSDVTHFTCSGYTQENQSSASNNLATVSGSIPGVLAGPLSNVPGFIQMGAGDIHVSGNAADSCPPGGNGRGVGHGPQAAGNYDFNTNQAFAIYQSADYTQFLEIIATQNVNVTNAKGGPAPVASGARTNNGPVTSGDTSVEIRLSDYNTGTYFSGCYEIPSSAFRSDGLTSAALSVYLDGSQPFCPNDPFDQQNVPLPLTVKASWAGTGPSAPFSDLNQFSCASYNTQSRGVVNALTANSSFTLPELYPGQEFDSAFSSLNTSAMRMHATGTDPQNCIVRG